MQRLTYLLFRFSQWLFKLLPLKALYFLSPPLSFILHRLIGYRKDIVQSNLRKCFPNWSQTKISGTTKAFYRYLSNIFLESLKGASLTEAELKEKITVSSQGILEKLDRQKSSAIFILGHYGNWEIAAIRYALGLKSRGVAVYKKINNSLINDYFIRTRERTGLNMWSIEEFKQKRDEVFNEPTILFLIADQNPSFVDKAYWCNFFENPLPWYQGPEQMARKFQVPVYFAKISYIQQGTYHIDLQPMHYDIDKDGSLTRAFVRHLEEQIRESPVPWLWTHKRWKRAHLYDPMKHKVID